LAVILSFEISQGSAAT